MQAYEDRYDDVLTATVQIHTDNAELRDWIIC
jgi:hypothetical protein